MMPTGQVAFAQDGPKALGDPGLPEQRVTEVKKADEPGAKKARKKVAADKAASAARSHKAKAEATASWPKSGSKAFTLKAGGVSGKAGDLPVTLSAHEDKKSLKPGSKARITVLDQKAAAKADVTGVLLTAISDASGSARLTIDYSKFAAAAGGAWGARLRLVELPACALTTPDKAACRKQTPLTSHNDITSQTVTAPISLTAESGPATQLRTSSDSGSMTVLALAAAASAGPAPSGAGDYSATPLSTSSSWAAGGNSGSYTWDYDFTLPPAAAGPEPALALSYDSGSVDGRTATTNNQGSALGEGFSLTESYIERSYGSCDDDGHKDVFDRCWKYDNAQLVLNGKSTRLVKKSGSWDSTWHLAGDDASKVTRHTSATPVNGDDNGEYWTVTTGDGTQYVFGKHKLDGATDERTNSVWTAPVFGDDTGEPGYANGDAFADRAETQAWRWNLDYVVDTSGNATTYWYTKESNHYKKNKASTANASYTRGGYLKEIQYGLRKGALFTDKADAKVTFSYSDRCTTSDCAPLTKDTADQWPDVPFDSICTDGDTDCLATSPSFFSLKRLTGISTHSWSAADNNYQPVDSWAFTQKYEDGGDLDGDTSDHVLTLQTIKRTGKTGSADITTNPVSFTYQWRENRVDGTDDILPLTRPRISTITSETGGVTTVTLSSPECVRSQVIDAPADTNTRNCFPQYWNINGNPEASIDWFHKYRVTAVLESDPGTGNLPVEHAYDYSGAAWHHADSPFTPKDERTWSDWRGYRQVTTYTGATDTTRSKTVSLYMQGMDGDKQSDGTTRSVSTAPLAAPALGIAAITDADQYAGQLRQQVTYNGSTPIESVVNDPWSKETARQTAPEADDHVARYVRTKKTTTHTYLAASKTWRAHAVGTTYDDYGMPVLVEDAGQVGKGGDNTCTRTWYARNADAGITNLVSRTRTVGQACSVLDTALSLPSTSTTRGDVLADTATVYDNPAATTWTPNQTPIKGLVTWTGRPTGYAATADSNGQRNPSGWQAVTTTTHDSLGRPLSTTNADNKTSTIAYTPADAGPLTRTITINAKGHQSVAFLDPRRGQPIRSYDANSKKTEQTYDSLGRLTAVWLPNQPKATDYAANITLKYQLNTTGPSWVSTSTLKKDRKTYNTSYSLYDSLLRPVQTQTPTPLGGRLLTDTRYDTRGLAYETHADIFDTSSTPNGTYVRAEYGESPSQTMTVYDGAERATTSTLLVGGKEKWSTTTSYTGDSTATTAVQGGTAQRTITDIRGRIIETRTYAGEQPNDTEYGSSPGVAYQAVTHQYTLDGQESSVTGSDGAKWTYGYDLYGRKTKVSDPDKGQATLAYNALDQQVKATDSRGKSILTDYDEIGRPLATWSGTKSDATQLTAHSYDTLLKGLPVDSTRYVGGKTGRAYTQAITAYDIMSRPVAAELRLPDTDPLVAAGAPATIPMETEYNPDGSLQFNKEPALGGLPSEPVEYGYNDQGMVTSINGHTGYLLETDYSALGQPLKLTLGAANTPDHKKAYINNRYEEGTGRLTRSFVTDETHSYWPQDLNYTYDQAGNVTKISDPATLGGTTTADTQCFTYDSYRRLTEAWTPSSQDCSAPRNADQLSGPAPYWNSYTYNSSSQRTSETKHTSTGDTTTTYCYTGQQPHTLTATSTAANCDAPNRTYSYDAAGNTTSRPGPNKQQTLSWNEEGDLAKVTEDGKATEYLYDAAGELLIRSTTGGERVLYAGDTELHLRADGSTWAQRHYGTDEVTVAVRSNETGSDRLSYLAADHHSTSTLAIDAIDQTYTKRHMDPFGNTRGASAGSWPNDKGFIGKTSDATTGLTHIGARQYDPALGQFISVDPLLETDKAQTLNGYSYSINNPLTFSDPTGMYLACGGRYEACPTKKPKPRPNTAVSGGNPGSPGNSGSYVPWTPGSKKRILANPSKGRYNVYGNQGRNSYGPNHVYTQAQWNVDHANAQQRQAIDNANRKDKENAQRTQNKKSGWDSFTSGLGDAWDATGGEVASAAADVADSVWDHRKEIGAALIGVAGFAGGALCGASIVCGVAVGIGAGVTAYVVANGKKSTMEGALWAGGTGAIGGGVAAKIGGSPYAMQLKSTLRMKFRLWKLDRKLQGIKRDIYE
ncbi:RHS repeat-associated core domain-containing protein [Streptomyces sp. KMM 9044]|uniref:RHS repeat-associated core domain-containing protein n=1 Tax=Streptomyces sp. KMM 9044 TaxID=2744474 RepID=UPI002151C7A9|nr:RHS repeat-associated core domain-containing protein [Streptomyces sp. KMM 9044]WAX81709.1 RHS repeat-associated core domain-containing protein [Streptomyces sp. KMM 9044]